MKSFQTILNLIGQPCFLMLIFPVKLSARLVGKCEGHGCSGVANGCGWLEWRSRWVWLEFYACYTMNMLFIVPVSV